MQNLRPQIASDSGGSGPRTPTGPKGRAPHVALLQVVGTLAIMAVHIGLRGAAVGWIAVECFFVIAGFNMIRAFEHSENTAAFAVDRAARLGPEVLLVWLVCLILFMGGSVQPTIVYFLSLAPVFLENFVQTAAPHPDPTIPWTFVHALWFIAALFQLQLVVFLFRRFAARLPHTTLLVLAAVGGCAFRFAFVWMAGARHADLPIDLADNLYRMPFTHIEALILGLVIGRGGLPGLGRAFLPLLAASVAAGRLTLQLHPAMPSSSLGLPATLYASFAYIWGYPLLALLCGSVVSATGPAAWVVLHARMADSTSRRLSWLSRASYGAYVFHGLVLSLIRLTADQSRLGWRYGSRVVVLLIVATVSFFLAGAFRWGWRRLLGWLTHLGRAQHAAHA